MINGIRRVGIYGGSFAPPHNGHVNAAREFMRQMKLDYLYVVPAAVPPHKSLDVKASAKDRLKMCELAFADIDGVIVSDCEIKRGGVSYTVDTLRELSAPDARLFLLCGTDMLLSLDTWYEHEEIFKLCYPIYVRRENDPIISARIIKKIGEYSEKYGAIVRRVVCEPLEVSSTLVRERLAAHGSISDLVPPSVEKYIVENGLFGVGNERD